MGTRHGSGLLIMVLALTQAGCTRQAWYQGVRQGAEMDCLNQPPGVAERCLERLNQQSYADYERLRAEAQRPAPEPARKR